MSAWKKLSSLEHKEMWDRFCNKFDFRPSIKAEDWPSIREPAESCTFAVGHFYGEEIRYERLVNELTLCLVGTLKRIVGPKEGVVVLDWHHSSYLLDLEKLEDLDESEDWPIPVFPNGDYFIYLTQNFEYGFFGHPWEQSICVFGTAYLNAVRAHDSEALRYLMRENGRAISS